MALAIAAAIALDRWSPVRRAVEPLLVASQTIPIVAIAPLFVIWFGFGLLPKVVIVVLVTFFPVTVVLLDGFGRVDPAAMDLMRSMGATSSQAFRRLRWPATLPYLFTGLRISVVYAVIGAIFGEYVGATSGLGIWMQLSQNSFRTDLVFAAMLLTAIISLLLYALVGVIERLVVPWAPKRRAHGGGGGSGSVGRRHRACARSPGRYSLDGHTTGAVEGSACRTSAVLEILVDRHGAVAVTGRRRRRSPSP